MIFGIRCIIRGSGYPSPNWGLRNRSRYPSAKKRKGRAHEWSRNQGLETLTIRVSASKLHTYIRGSWACVWSGWGYVTPIPRNPWTKAEDLVGPLWVVCSKEVGTVGTLGILVTIPLEAPARLGGTKGWTTWLARVNGIIGMLDLGLLTGGGRIPSAGMAEVKMKEISHALDIILPAGTPIMGR